MKTEDILKLKDAGFSNDDIIKFATAYDATMIPEAPQDTPANPEPAPKPETTSNAEKVPAWAEQFSQEIKNLTRTIQASNIRNVSMPETKTKDPVDILGELIAPPLNKEGK